MRSRASQRLRLKTGVRRPGLIGAALLLLTWFVVSHFGLLGATLIASPAEVWHTLAASLLSPPSGDTDFRAAAMGTILRATEGWAVSLVLGIPLGLILGRIALAYEILEPVLEFFRSIPPILAFPVLLVIFNYGTPSYVWTIVFGGVPIMILTVAKGTLQVSRERLEILEIFNVAPYVKAFATTMEILPSVFLGMRLIFSISLVIAVVCEMVFTPRSGNALGSLARDAEISFRTPLFYACVVVVGAYGYAVNSLFQGLERWLGEG